MRQTPSPFAHRVWVHGRHIPPTFLCCGTNGHYPSKPTPNNKQDRSPYSMNVQEPSGAFEPQSATNKNLEGDMALAYSLPEEPVSPVERILLAERIRIAQELHDTLLQGFVSALMQLHVAVDHLPTHSPTKPPLRRVLQLMTQVIEEGRNAILRLPSSSGENLDLERAFSEILERAFSEVNEELGLPQKIAFRVIVL